MKATPDFMELKDELENDLALAMLVERRLARKIGSEQARALIGKIKDVLQRDDPDEAGNAAQDLNATFPFH